MKKCKTCQETKEHYANGLCESCYNKLRYKTDQNVRNYYKSKTYEWRKKNPNKWKAIMKRASKKFYEKKRIKVYPNI